MCSSLRRLCDRTDDPIPFEICETEVQIAKMGIASKVVRRHIRFFGGALVVEAFCVASALATIYLHFDPLNYIVTIVANILSAF